MTRGPQPGVSFLVAPTPNDSKGGVVADLKALLLGYRNVSLFSKRDLKLEKSTVAHFYCLALTDDEAGLAERSGVYRAMMSAFEGAEACPFPFFIDRDRKSAVTGATGLDGVVMSNSDVKFPVTRLNVIHAAEKGNVTLYVPNDRITEFKEVMATQALNMTKPTLILSDIHDSVDAMQTHFRIPKEHSDSFWIEFMSVGITEAEGRARLPIEEMQAVVNSVPVPSDLLYWDYWQFDLCFSCWGFNWMSVRRR
ncbi:hypothetical protein QBC38DRAFT_519325 [Podospora fimiseda]|uniref:Uncharacterized protein n=1 Tax=Podospora fimiseda TaxID=252190 RepID=A0AAN7BFR0_9PEZI|nr:hypothetical protein QBC38DRAFT_519325 [Podospora fimiseda]